MMFSIDKASEWFAEPDKKEVETLEDLIAIQKLYGDHSLVIDFTKNEITIYDDYLE